MSFKERVLKAVSRIPEGKTLSYKEVAAVCGSPGAARAVGNIMKGNRDPKVPCHRVIKSDGSLGGYNRGAEEKKRKLRDEGVNL